MNEEAAADDLLDLRHDRRRPNRQTVVFTLNWFDEHPPSPHHPALSQLEELRSQY